MQQLDLFDEQPEKKASTLIAEYRIVVVDGFIVAEVRHNGGRWYTRSKDQRNCEESFAVWPHSELNMKRAHQHFDEGETFTIVYAPNNWQAVESHGKWYESRANKIDLKVSHESQNAAIRALAASL